MDYLYPRGDGTYDVHICTIDEAYSEAMSLAQATSNTIIFHFNDVIIRIAADSDLRLIERDRQRAERGYLGDNPVIGPHPKPQLSHEERERDEAIRRHKEAMAATRQKIAHYEAIERIARRDDLLQNAPAIDVKDETAWHRLKQGTTESMARSLVDGAEEWARLMQASMQRNSITVSEAADRTFELSWCYGNSGAATTGVVTLLVAHWKHGHELKLWHNAIYGVSATEAGRGVIDPTQL